MPYYPEIRIQLHTRHPLAWISAVRYGLRRQGVDLHEIRRFTEEAFGAEEPTEVERICSDWAIVEQVIPNSNACGG